MLTRLRKDDIFTHTDSESIRNEADIHVRFLHPMYGLLSPTACTMSRHYFIIHIQTGDDRWWLCVWEKRNVADPSLRPSIQTNYILHHHRCDYYAYREPWIVFPSRNASILFCFLWLFYRFSLDTYHPFQNGRSNNKFVCLFVCRCALRHHPSTWHTKFNHLRIVVLGQVIE